MDIIIRSASDAVENGTTSTLDSSIRVNIATAGMFFILWQEWWGGGVGLAHPNLDRVFDGSFGIAFVFV
jgi:hypothetical protein